MPKSSGNNSIETILTFDNRDAQSDWSVVWSTTHIPGMDNAIGGGSRRLLGRRRLMYGTLVLGTCLTMHCRVAAAALTGGFFIFMFFLVLSVVLLANPLRHFEVYLGQWSISGPGRAFRMVPMLEGIGIAICINAIFRAIVCCLVASIAGIYVVKSLSDEKLPFTYCRNFNLKTYEPVNRDVKSVLLRESRFSLQTALFDNHEVFVNDNFSSDTTVGTLENGRKTTTKLREMNNMQLLRSTQTIQTCLENYTDGYPPLYSTPPYNFFYVEVVQYRSDLNYGQFNMSLILGLIVVWSLMWALMLSERLRYGRLIWNNTLSWLVVVPWVWTLILIIIAASHVSDMKKDLEKILKIGAKEILSGIADALEAALYIHSSGVGTELILGKGLNHYASGHIDPNLNSENVWYSSIVLLLAGVHSAGAAICAVVDQIHPSKGDFGMHESTLWIIPMYSNCALVKNYSHAATLAIFGGMMFSYLATAFILLKTALHTIFEYKVKLVFVEQAVVGSLLLTCLGLSLICATNGGIALLESVDAIMTGVATPTVCLLELIAMIYVYRSRDFVSDMNVATEENTCPSRLSTQWQIIPVVTVVTIIMKIIVLCSAEMPKISLYIALAPLVGVVISVPLRACQNAYVFLKPRPRYGV